MFTTQPILSYTRKQYCPVNAEVTIISHGDICIVEYNGDRFPVRRELLAEDMVEVVEGEVVNEIKSQLELF